MQLPTYRVLCLEAFVHDTGVGAKPEEHGGTCWMLGGWPGVSTEAGNETSVDCWAIPQLQVVIQTAEKHEVKDMRTESQENHLIMLIAFLNKT